MNFQDETERERHFVLHVMHFVYGISGKPLPSCLQEILDKYPRDEEKYCTKNITQALLMYISDYLDSDFTLVDLSSESYQDQIDNLLQMYRHYDFLRFLAHYALKARFEYYEKKLLDSPMKFFSSIVRFLEEMRNNRHDIEFWESLDKAAEKVVAKGIEIIKSRHNKPLDSSDEDNAGSDREFVLLIMQTISRLYSNPLPDYLRLELDAYMMVSLTDFHPNFEVALKLEAENLERSIANLDGDDAIYDYYYQLCTKNFSAKHFLEFSLCSTRKALLDFYVHSKNDAPMRVCDRLCYILQNAKKDGKLRSLDALVQGANQIIDDDEERKGEHKGFEVSTEYFSDFSTVSTAPSSDRDNLFESFEQSITDTDSMSVTRKNAQLAIDSLIASVTDAQPDIKGLTISVQGVKPKVTGAAAPKISKSPTKNLTVSSDDAQLAAENLIASGEKVQPAGKKIATAQNAQPAIENLIASSESDQKSIESSIAPIKDASTCESKLGSSSEQAPDSNLLGSSEQVPKTSCHCCTAL